MPRRPATPPATCVTRTTQATPRDRERRRRSPRELLRSCDGARPHAVDLRRASAVERSTRSRACGEVAGHLPPLVERRVAPRRSATSSIVRRPRSPAPSRAACSRCGVGEAERAGRVGIGALDQPERERARPDRGHPVVPVGARPRRRARPVPPGRRTRAISASAPPGVGHEHVRRSGTGRRRRTRRGGRSPARRRRRYVDVVEAELARRARAAASTISGATSVESSRPSGAEPRGGEEAGVARPGGEVEHRLARLRVEQRRPCARRRHASRPRRARAAAPSRRRPRSSAVDLLGRRDRSMRRPRRTAG